MTVTFSPAALLDTVPESVTASPRITVFRLLVIETERVFCPTVSVPVKPAPFAVGSWNLNVPGVAKVHDELCPGSRLNLHVLLSTMTWWSAVSVFFHVTESPLMIVIVVSLNPSFVTSTARSAQRRKNRRPATRPRRSP